MFDQCTVRVFAPSECSADEVAAFSAHVNQGGEVADLSPARIVARGLKLAFVRCDGVLAAVGALKKPAPNYQAECFRKAGVVEQRSAYPVELGWVYCSDFYRGGMSYRIIDALLSDPEGHESMFATVRTDNPSMSVPFKRRGFLAIGKSYPSTEHQDAMIQLFVRTAKLSD
jgi:hypothetical protein